MKKSSFFKKSNANKIVFYFATLAFPVIQFCVFYIGVNFNSIVYAFSFYDYSQPGVVIQSFVWFDNFIKIFEMFKFQPEMVIRVENSLLGFIIGFGISTPLGILFSYYIYKNRFAAKVFKIMLFLPQILSAMVLAVMLKYFVNRGLPFAMETIFGVKIPGLLPKDAVSSSIMPTMIVFTIFCSFGSTMRMYVGTMGNVSDSVIESAQIDGASPIREFFDIIFPCIYPTFVTFVVVEVATIFTLQMHSNLQAKWKKAMTKIIRQFTVLLTEKQLQPMKKQGCQPAKKRFWQKLLAANILLCTVADNTFTLLHQAQKLTLQRTVNTSTHTTNISV